MLLWSINLKAWHAAAHGVAKSQTQLSYWTAKIYQKGSKKKKNTMEKRCAGKTGHLHVKE